ncbi:transcriptional regulator, ArsR family [Cognatiyoonia sediminum]|uniref:Transcriptional regulator, ArsR family n=1 Tax=Cognatiyoonia sediminum TaxID=1508389 RepID=A0A1M5NGK1_9RHOB|nr:metalloregulator ArsR/SmtB family transcription factor [Cognatiyoonia sediminum]SHG88648.1 transcriptional regulator, ArsR family [Cognatiyoonia sediminum]
MSDSLSTILAALSDPTRRAVVERLILGQASVSELHAPHDMALPTFMRHLNVLEASGLVRSIKRGRVRTCQISMAPILEVQGWLAWQTTLREGRED